MRCVVWRYIGMVVWRWYGGMDIWWYGGMVVWRWYGRGMEIVRRYGGGTPNVCTTLVRVVFPCQCVYMCAGVCVCRHSPVMGLLLSSPGIQVRRTLLAARSDSSRSLGASGRPGGGWAVRDATHTHTRTLSHKHTQEHTHNHRHTHTHSKHMTHIHTLHSTNCYIH